MAEVMSYLPTLQPQLNPFIYLHYSYILFSFCVRLDIKRKESKEKQMTTLDEAYPVETNVEKIKAAASELMDLHLKELAAYDYEEARHRKYFKETEQVLDDLLGSINRATTMLGAVSAGLVSPDMKPDMIAASALKELREVYRGITGTYPNQGRPQPDQPNQLYAAMEQSWREGREFSDPENEHHWDDKNNKHWSEHGTWASWKFRKDAQAEEAKART